MKKVEKAIEISDARIQFVSLVDKAANQRQFLIAKAANGRAKFTTVGRILKVDAETHYVTGIVYEPLVEDTQGNYMTEAEIRKAAYWFIKNGDKVDLQHSFEPVEGVAVVENYVAPCAMEIGGEQVAKGAWVMTAEVQNPEVWAKIQKGEVTGFSMGGTGSFSEIDAPIAESEKKGLIKRLAGIFGLDVVEKGEVKDEFEGRDKESGFWNAFDALQSVLSRYDWYDDERKFTDDEETIKEALAEFAEIVTELLAAPNVAKALSAGAPVRKSGKKISGKNHKALQTIHDSLGALLSELADESEEKNENENETEGNEVKKETKDNIKDIVSKSIKKAVEAKKKALKKNDVDDAAQDAAETIGDALGETLEEALAEAVGDAIKEAVDDAIEEAVGDAVKEAIGEAVGEAIPEAIKGAIEEALQGMVDGAVEKAVAPVLKARGLPSNANGEGQKEVNKSSEAFDGFFV